MSSKFKFDVSVSALKSMADDVRACQRLVRTMNALQSVSGDMSDSLSDQATLAVDEAIRRRLMGIAEAALAVVGESVDDVPTT